MPQPRPTRPTRPHQRRVADPTLTPAILEEVFARALGRQANDLFRDRMLAMLLQTAVAGGESTAATMGISSTLGPSHYLLRRLATTHIPKITQINDTTRERVRNALLQALTEGENLPGQVRAIRSVFTEATRSRAVTIARTENAAFWNGGGRIQMVEGGAMGHLWITARDLRRRASHVPMEGQCKPIDQPFVSGAGNLLMHPGDPNGPPEEVINCRCVEVPQLRPCDARSLQFSTEERRTLHWKSVIPSVEAHERLAFRTVRSLFQQQRQDVLDAIQRLVA